MPSMAPRSWLRWVWLPISPCELGLPPDPASLNAYDFDLDKAAQLMDEAGWTMGDDGFRYKDGKSSPSTGWFTPSLLGPRPCPPWRRTPGSSWASS